MSLSWWQRERPQPSCQSAGGSELGGLQCSRQLAAMRVVACVLWSGGGMSRIASQSSVRSGPVLGLQCCCCLPHPAPRGPVARASSKPASSRKTLVSVPLAWLCFVAESHSARRRCCPVTDWWPVWWEAGRRPEGALPGLFINSPTSGPEKGEASLPAHLPPRGLPRLVS